MATLDPQSELQRSIRAFEDALEALDIQGQPAAILKAAASSWAKAKAAETVATFIERRRDGTHLGPN